MSNFKFWFKPRCAYLMLLIFVKLSEYEMLAKPSANSARYYLYIREKDSDLDRLLDGLAFGYAYPKIYNIRERYNMLYHMIDQAENSKIHWI